MTERERLLEKIRKVQALANRGADGEKQSAAALLDRLMTQYGIDEAEIAEERLEKCFFRYKTPYERKLLVQVIYTVTGKIPFKCVGSYSGRARKQVGIDCTAAERLEIEFSYEFYKAALEEEMERFYVRCRRAVRGSGWCYQSGPALLSRPGHRAIGHRGRYRACGRVYFRVCTEPVVRAGRLGLQQSAGKRAGSNLPGFRPAVVIHYAARYLGGGHNALFDLGV